MQQLYGESLHFYFLQKSTTSIPEQLIESKKNNYLNKRSG